MIDIYTHIFPDKFYEVLTKTSPKLGNIGEIGRASCRERVCWIV